MKKACEIRISGIVQGVGYRPFIYKNAVRMNICGYVANTGGEVLVHAEGNEDELRLFSEYLKKNSPEGSKVETFSVSPVKFKHLTDFKILQSISDNNASRTVPPDISVCDNCVKDISDSTSRYFSYPFTSCTKCGPRFSIVSNIPYDRENTSMNHFEMCDECRKEYKNPEDRRHHAQTICCPKCGPSFELLDSHGIKQSGEPFGKARMLIKQGNILAVKGVGGYHLICHAKNDKAVEELRMRKKRERKPFAVMFRDFDSVGNCCFIEENEKKLLRSREKPIVLLQQKDSSCLSTRINPGLNRIGAMLPYSGIHFMLFDNELDSLTATSGNISGEPLIIDDAEALEKLKLIADYFLIHNREILSRCDDSVMFCEEGENLFIRRARGFAPVPIKITGNNTGKCVIAFGADLKSTIALCKNNNIYGSQFIGELESRESAEIYKKTIKSYIELFNIHPEIGVCDAHPDYYSSNTARKSGIEILEVQHHYAHIASVIAENRIEGEVIGAAFDGIGWGTDETVWGGEFLKASLKGFERIGHIEQVPLPGGDLGAKEPWRMAAVYLHKVFGPDYKNLKIPCVDEIIKNNGDILIKASVAGINTVLSSSAGRLFDAVSAMLGVCYFNTYEGQASSELEAVADTRVRENYIFEIKNDGELIICFSNTIKSLVEDFMNGIDVSIISAKFHNTVALSIYEMCRKISEETGIKKAALSGGVFQNRLLLVKTINLLEQNGFDIYINKQVPCNDGGISLGQLAICNEQLKIKNKHNC